MSVTQAFNTTSSMGRLTLNVLLSFAQFEREVTAERIRDKVAASKRKGMWMGGAIPLGYEVIDKALVVNPTGAKAFRTIFNEYLATGSVRERAVRLGELGIFSKRRTNRYGRVSGGASFSRGALYNILRNPIYIGKVRHKEELHEGLHDAIINDATWKSVQTQLADHGGKKISAIRRSAKRLLDGVLFDAEGRAMRTTYASKSIHTDGTTRTKRYCYYTSTLIGSVDKTGLERLPANELERVVLIGLRGHLSDANWLADQIKGDENKTTLVTDILGALSREKVVSDGPDDTGSVQTLQGILNRIDAKNDRLLI